MVDDSEKFGKQLQAQTDAGRNTRLQIFGEKRILPNLNLRREFSWNFLVAAVPYAIIGADLLAHYHLIPVLHESRLVDSTTGVSTRGSMEPAAIHGVSTVAHSAPYSRLLSEFPEITRVLQTQEFQVRDVEQHILTKGQPIAERAGRLPPDKLIIAKMQFKEMIEAGICRPSSSPWAAPILMKRKKLPEIECCHDTRQISGPAPTRFFGKSTRKNYFLQARPPQGVPSNSDNPRRFSKNGRNHTIWSLRIYDHDFRIPERRSIVPTVHPSRFGRSRFCFHLHRRYSRCFLKSRGARGPPADCVPTAQRFRVTTQRGQVSIREIRAGIAGTSGK